MTTSQLRKSRALWRARELYRYAKWRFYRYTSRRPNSERMKLRKKWWKLYKEAKGIRKRRDRQIAELQSWGGSRAVTNEVIQIVGGRAPVTSRKRPADHPLSLANPYSDHNAANKNSDAVDFGIADAHWLKNEISRKLGGPRNLVDYGTFVIKRNGKKFRVQIIAGTHGTGPHLHVGVRRI